MNASTSPFLCGGPLFSLALEEHAYFFISGLSTTSSMLPPSHSFMEFKSLSVLSYFPSLPPSLADFYAL